MSRSAAAPPCCAESTATRAGEGRPAGAPAGGAAARHPGAGAAPSAMPPPAARATASAATRADRRCPTAGVPARWSFDGRRVSGGGMVKLLGWWATALSGPVAVERHGAARPGFHLRCRWPTWNPKPVSTCPTWE
ncbi:MAG: hypothetical protein DYG90_14580 [Chloroflexi bacterium CFX6]|nr:hypothetical protein [Chloroflexi bacterium CFX6]